MTRECNACDWTGPDEETVYCGQVGPLCPECHETTFPVIRFKTLPIGELLSAAFQAADRRQHLSRHAPPCPKCATRQVQLVGYIDTYPAEWKCRECKHKFTFEHTTETDKQK